MTTDPELAQDYAKDLGFQGHIERASDLYGRLMRMRSQKVTKPSEIEAVLGDLLGETMFLPVSGFKQQLRVTRVEAEPHPSREGQKLTRLFTNLDKKIQVFSLEKVMPVGGKLLFVVQPSFMSTRPTGGKELLLTMDEAIERIGAMADIGRSLYKTSSELYEKGIPYPTFDDYELMTLELAAASVGAVDRMQWPDGSAVGKIGFDAGVTDLFSASY